MTTSEFDSGNEEARGEPQGRPPSAGLPQPNSPASTHERTANDGRIVPRHHRKSDPMWAPNWDDLAEDDNEAGNEAEQEPPTQLLSESQRATVSVTHQSHAARSLEDGPQTVAPPKPPALPPPIVSSRHRMNNGRSGDTKPYGSELQGNPEAAAIPQPVSDEPSMTHPDPFEQLRPGSFADHATRDASRAEVGHEGLAGAVNGIGGWLRRAGASLRERMPNAIKGDPTASASTTPEPKTQALELGDIEFERSEQTSPAAGAPETGQAQIGEPPTPNLSVLHGAELIDALEPPDAPPTSSVDDRDPSVHPEREEDLEALQRAVESGLDHAFPNVEDSDTATGLDTNEGEAQPRQPPKRGPAGVEAARAWAKQLQTQAQTRLDHVDWRAPATRRNLGIAAAAVLVAGLIGFIGGEDDQTSDPGNELAQASATEERPAESPETRLAGLIPPGEVNETAHAEPQPRSDDPTSEALDAAALPGEAEPAPSEIEAAPVDSDALALAESETAETPEADTEATEDMVGPPSQGDESAQAPAGGRAKKTKSRRGKRRKGQRGKKKQDNQPAKSSKRGKDQRDRDIDDGSETPEHKKLLARARKARGEKSYRLAKRSLDLFHSREALETMTVAACQMKDRDLARKAFKQLPVDRRRRGVRKGCKEHGIRLGLGWGI